MRVKIDFFSHGKDKAIVLFYENENGIDVDAVILMLKVKHASAIAYSAIRSQLNLMKTTGITLRLNPSLDVIVA